MADPYCYPGTDTLKNHYGILDREELREKEQRTALKTLHRLVTEPVEGRFDLEHLREIHRRIFEPIFPFAGELRYMDMVKAEEKLDGASVQYAPFHLIGSLARRHLEELNRADWSGLKEMSRPQDMAVFAQKIADIWQVHPFREGNTRSTMMFMHQFAEAHGFALDRGLLRQHADFVRHALVVGTYGQIEHLTRILTDARQRELAREQGESEVLMPARAISASISTGEVEERLAGNSSVKTTERDLNEIAGVVFAAPAPVLTALRRAAFDGEIGDKSLVETVRQSPERLGELKGKTGLLVGGVERRTRDEAVKAIPRLSAVAGRYLSLVHGVRSTMRKEREREAQRAGVEVPAPSAALMAALGKGETLADGHKAELKSLLSALERRLGDDLQHMRAGRDLDGIAARQGLDPKMLDKVRGVIEVLDRGQAAVRAEARQKTRNEVQAMERGGGPTR